MERRQWPRTHDELSEGPIQVRVASVEHLFNPMDPSPLDERSLDQEVADWIEEWAEDLDHDHPVEVEIHVADDRLNGREEAIVHGLHSHFEYRKWQTARQLRKLLREGRISLVIGLAALAGFNAVSHLGARMGLDVEAVGDLALRLVADPPQASRLRTAGRVDDHLRRKRVPLSSTSLHRTIDAP